MTKTINGIICLLFLLLATEVSAQAVKAPKPAGRWVVDDADMLSDETEAMLSHLLNAHEDSTSNQVLVYTIPTLGDEVLEDFANKTYNEWGIGQADNDNGVLLLVAENERKVRIEVGYGLEGFLTDLEAKAIIDNEIVPEFQKGDFDAGVINGVKAILGSIEGTYSPNIYKNVDYGGLIPVLIIFGVFALFASKSKGCAGGIMSVIFITVAAGSVFGFIGLVPAIITFVVLMVIMLIIRLISKRSNSWWKSGGGGYSSGGSSWSSGGGGGWSGGGGGFSGGGGSSGGGGASGGW